MSLKANIQKGEGGGRGGVKQVHVYCVVLYCTDDSAMLEHLFCICSANSYNLFCNKDSVFCV